MFTFGSDPEFMLCSADGKLKSAIGVIPGTKEIRHNLGDGFECYYDNVLTEVSIKPSKSAEEAEENFRECLTRLANVAKPYQLLAQASARYPAEECTHPDALLFGCHPEMNAYSMSMVEPPTCEGTFRSGGGHVHLGYDGGVTLPQTTDNEEANFAIAWDRVYVIQMCDLLLGINSLRLDKDPSSKERRKLYGGAGMHRCCDAYGVEYRTLSNYWIARPSLVRLHFSLAALAVKFVQERKHDDILAKAEELASVPDVINNWNNKKAQKLFDYIDKELLPSDVATALYAELEKPYNASVVENWEIKLT